MKPNPIDQLAIWLPMNTEKLDAKVFPAGYPYSKGNLILHSSIGTPIIRYAKNYSVDGLRLSLCIISNENDSKAMEDWMDKQSQRIDPDTIKSPFQMTDIHYEKAS
jgi:hypothetical protein